MKHRVGHVERIGEGGTLVGDPEQVLVRDHDQRIDMSLHLLDAGLGLPHAALAFEVERPGHDAHRQDATLARGAGDDRSRAGAGTTAHAGGDEDHVAVGELAHHSFNAFFGGGAADIGLGAGAEALGDRRSELDLARGERMRQRLAIGVRHQEINAVEIGTDHVVDGIAAGAADTDHGDTRAKFLHGLRNGQIDGHDCLPVVVVDHVAACAGNTHGLAAVGCGVLAGPVAPAAMAGPLERVLEKRVRKSVKLAVI